MRAIDSNVLVRALTHDDARQVALADAFVENGAWVSVLALAEAMWVFSAVYDRSASDIANTVEKLLQHPIVERFAQIATHARMRPARILGWMKALLELVFGRYRTTLCVPWFLLL